MWNKHATVIDCEGFIFTSLKLFHLNRGHHARRTPPRSAMILPNKSKRAKELIDLYHYFDSTLIFRPYSPAQYVTLSRNCEARGWKLDSFSPPFRKCNAFKSRFSSISFLLKKKKFNQWIWHIINTRRAGGMKVCCFLMASLLKAAADVCESDLWDESAFARRCH